MSDETNELEVYKSIVKDRNKEIELLRHTLRETNELEVYKSIVKDRNKEIERLRHTIRDMGDVSTELDEADKENGRLREALEIVENQRDLLEVESLKDGATTTLEQHLKFAKETHHPMEEDGDMLGGKRDE